MWLLAAGGQPPSWLVAIIVGLPATGAAVYATWQSSKADRNKTGNAELQAVLTANQQLVETLQGQQQYERDQRIQAEARHRKDMDDMEKQLHEAQVRADHATRAKGNAEADADRARAELAAAQRTLGILRAQGNGT